MAETFEAYVRKNLVETVDPNEFLKNPAYSMARAVMKMEYEQLKGKGEKNGRSK